jgi:hypothetical protein
MGKYLRREVGKGLVGGAEGEEWLAVSAED